MLFGFSCFSFETVFVKLSLKNAVHFFFTFKFVGNTCDNNDNTGKKTYLVIKREFHTYFQVFTAWLLDMKGYINND